MENKEINVEKRHRLQLRNLETVKRSYNDMKEEFEWLSLEASKSIL